MSYKLYIQTKGTFEREPILQDRSVIPSASGQIVAPAEGFDGIRTVTVLGDENLKPSNIKSGVTIFNVLGTYGSPFDYFQCIKRIDNNAFTGCETIHNIQLPEGLEYLGNNVFSECGYLNKVIIDSPNLVFGGSHTFSNSSLTSIEFLQTDYEMVENNLLRECFNLKDIVVPDGWNTDLNFSDSDLEFEVLYELINNLKDNSKDKTKSIIMGQENLNKLNSEELDMLKDKNWDYGKE